MNIFIAFQNSDTGTHWRRLVTAHRAISFIGTSEVTPHFDAVIMSGMWAFDRYGGKPSRDAAQIVHNERGDGYPDFIIIPPFRPVIDSGSATVVRDDFRGMSPAYHAVKKSLAAVREELGVEVSVVLHLPLLGMDDPTDESTPRSVSEAIKEILPS